MSSIMENDKRIYTMSKERPVKAVVKMGVPVTVGMMFMVFYNIVDTYFIGMLNDDYQLAACNLAYPVLMFLIAISGIAGNGGASYIARCIGVGKKERAEKTLVISLELIFAGSVLTGAAGLLFLPGITDMLGADSDTFSYTEDYVRIMLLGNLFIMGNYAIGQLLRSEGSTFYSMVGMVLGTVMNIILDPLFIFVFNMELLGAALATVIGNALSILVYAYYYIRKKTLLMPHIKDAMPDKGIIREIMWVGTPHTLEQFLSTAAMLVLNNLAASYGALYVAAMGVANKIMSFGNYIYQGMAAGCQPLMGYNYGAGDTERLRKIIIAGAAVITSIEIIVMVLFGLSAPILIGLFSENEEVIAIGTMTLRSLMLMLPFVGIVSLVRNAFNSMGKPMYAFGITVIRQIGLYIPFLVIFSNIWGYAGLVHAQPAEELLCMIVSIAILERFLAKITRK